MNRIRLGEWFIKILKMNHDLEDIQLGDRMLRNVNLSEVLFNLNDREFMDILLAYYREWNVEKHLLGK